jgi:AcrR family transcriptional regulator
LFLIHFLKKKFKMNFMSKDQIMRKKPKQARSQKRVDQILDAAAQLFVEVGYETVTTNAIAARAEVPIGSLYQFFPNKEAVIDALTARYAEGTREVLSFDTTLSVTQNIEAFIDRFAYFSASHVGFEHLVMAAGKTTALHEEIVGGVEAVLQHYFPNINRVEINYSARVMVGIVKGVMALTAPPDNLPPPYLLEEVKATLKAYIRSVLLREGQPLPADLA